MKMRIKIRDVFDTERHDVLSGFEDRRGTAGPENGPKLVKHALIERTFGQPTCAVSDEDSVHQEGLVVNQIGILRRTIGRYITAIGAVLVLTATAVPVGAQTFANYPTTWPDDLNTCLGGGNDCWIPITRFGVPMQDLIAASDASHNSNPQPTGADIFNGENADQTAIWYGWNDTTDVVFLRKRLDGTPTLAVNGGSSPPGTADAGPFKGNTAWNFIFDFNGDGWGDIVASTDGNIGTNQDPGDTIRLGWGDTPGTQEVEIFGGGGKFDATLDMCTVTSPDHGKILFNRHANEDPAIEGCPTQESTVCDFTYTRVFNDCPTSPPVGCSTDDANFLMEMQFPREAFDDCLTAGDPDNDGVGGNQILYPDVPFILCVTTSTQPNDYTGKDLAAPGTFNMRKGRQLVCSDPCTLAGGCSEPPVIVDNELQAACGEGTNLSPVTMTALVIDTLKSLDGDTVVDTIATVEFEYAQNGSSVGYQSALSASTPVNPNPVVTPDTLPNTWTFDWKTSDLDVSGGSIYSIRVTVTDEELNETVGFYEIDLADSSCSPSTTPVNLAVFRASDQGDRTRFEWTTSTEAGTVGFNLYAIVDGQRQRLNEDLIPSKVVDSLEPQHYVVELPETHASMFEIEDVDILGHSRTHGPFELQRAYGRVVETDTINWRTIREEHRAEGSRWAGKARDRSAGDADTVAPAPAASGFSKKHRTFSPIDLRIDADGVYRVTYDLLVTEGFDLQGVSAGQIALLNRGEPVPIRVVTPKKGGHDFGPESFIEFVGSAVDSQYTISNVYRLLDDKKRALRIKEDNKKPSKHAEAPTFHMTTVTVNNQRRYSFSAPGDDPWYETYLLAYSSPVTKSFQILVDDLVPGAADAVLRADLWGMSSWPEAPDHHAVMRLNGVQVADELFDGIVDHPMTLSVPEGILREGVNTIEIQAPGDAGVPWDVSFVNEFALTYPRTFAANSGGIEFRSAAKVFEVEDLPAADIAVFRQTGTEVEYLSHIEIEASGDGYRARFAGTSTPARYLVVPASEIRAPVLTAAPAPVNLISGAADYLIISHPAFIEGLAPLVSFHESRGLRVEVVDVDDVYSQYSGGIVDPQAIKSHIAAAAESMGIRFVLLVGGDTYDYLDHLGRGSMSFVPTLYARTGPIVSRSPVDPLYADVDGDGVPDLAIGRFPVRTLQELETVVQNTLEYAAKNYGKTAIVAADATDPSSPVAFQTSSEAFIQKLPAEWTVHRAYIDSLGVAGARQKLIDTVNDGIALTTFVGHSDLTRWTFSGLFNSNDIAALENWDRPTVVIQWGCWNTYHVQPSYSTLGQRFLINDGGGAAAVLGATTLTLSASEDALGRLLMPMIVEEDMPIGIAITRAKQQLAVTRPDLHDVILGWTLLGDPALVVSSW